MRKILFCLIVACLAAFYSEFRCSGGKDYCGGGADRAVSAGRTVDDPGKDGEVTSLLAGGEIQTSDYLGRFSTELDRTNSLDFKLGSFLAGVDPLARTSRDKLFDTFPGERSEMKKVFKEEVKRTGSSTPDYRQRRSGKCQIARFPVGTQRELSNTWLFDLKSRSECVDKKAHKYLEIIHRASDQYGVDRSLIMAIIETESSFNPYAVSRSDAVGLMQVVQHSAGKDVFKMKGKLGQPSRKYLFNPVNNIDTGTAYLAMLQDIYLGGIVNPISRRYAVIVAYHSGVRSVLRIFSHSQEKAFRIINNLHPNEVYEVLYTKHPSAESRLYLCKVNSLSNTISEDLLRLGKAGHLSTS